MVDDIENNFESWLEEMKSEGQIPIIQQITQNSGDYEASLIVLYQVQKINVQVETEEIVPETINNFKITEFKKGMTLHFKLFLEEKELQFLAEEGEELIFEGVAQKEYADHIESLVMLKALRKKGILQNFNDSDGEGIFMGTELAQYLWKSFLELYKQKEHENS